jgi:hypothetical protein
MIGPFIFIATNRLKEGKLHAERRRVPRLSDFIEANQPRLIAFNEYVSDGRDARRHNEHSDFRTPTEAIQEMLRRAQGS